MKKSFTTTNGGVFEKNKSITDSISTKSPVSKGQKIFKDVVDGDEDLNPVLAKATNEDLNPLVQYILKANRTERLSSSTKYKKFKPDHQKYVDEIAKEIRLFGGNHCCPVKQPSLTN